MSLITLTLIAHVIIGLVGVIASYAVLMGLLKRNVSLSFVKNSALIAFVSYVASWILGGYYYVLYYGGNVKPIIKGGDYPWAHAIFMEAKEHIFLFLPFLSLSLFLAIVASGDLNLNNKPIKKVLAVLAGVIAVLGIFIALSGVVISGAAR